MSRIIHTLTTRNSTYEVSEGEAYTRLTCLRGTFEGQTWHLTDWDVQVVQVGDVWETRGAVFCTTDGGVIQTSRVLDSESVRIEALVTLPASSSLAGFQVRAPRPSLPQHEHCVFDWDERPSEANGHRWVVRDRVPGCPACAQQ